MLPIPKCSGCLDNLPYPGTVKYMATFKQKNVWVNFPDIGAAGIVFVFFRKRIQNGKTPTKKRGFLVAIVHEKIIKLICNKASKLNGQNAVAQLIDILIACHLFCGSFRDEQTPGRTQRGFRHNSPPSAEQKEPTTLPTFETATPEPHHASLCAPSLWEVLLEPHRGLWLQMGFVTKTRWINEPRREPYHWLFNRDPYIEYWFIMIPI